VLPNLPPTPLGVEPVVTYGGRCFSEPSRERRLSPVIIFILFCARALAYSNIRSLATLLAKDGVTGAFELNSKVNRRSKRHKQTPTDSSYTCTLLK